MAQIYKVDKASYNRREILLKMAERIDGGQKMDEKMVVLCGRDTGERGQFSRILCEKYHFVTPVCVTTRTPGKGEEEGKEYFFLSDSGFQSLMEHGDFFVCLEYDGVRFGVERERIQRILSCGRIPVVELPEEAALALKRKYEKEIVLLMTGRDTKWLEDFAGQEEKVMSLFFGSEDILKRKRELEEIRRRSMWAQRIFFGKRI